MLIDKYLSVFICHLLEINSAFDISVLSVISRLIGENDPPDVAAAAVGC